MRFMQPASSSSREGSGAFGTFRPDEKYMVGLLSPRKNACQWALPLAILLCDRGFRLCGGEQRALRSPSALLRILSFDEYGIKG